MPNLTQFVAEQIHYVEKLAKNFRQLLGLRHGEYDWETHFNNLKKIVPLLRAVSLKEIKLEIYDPDEKHFRRSCLHMASDEFVKEVTAKIKCLI